MVLALTKMEVVNKQYYIIFLENKGIDIRRANQNIKSLF